jgi:predicted nucleotidyltransferase
VLLSLVLFGSRARGDHRHTSDVDLLGVVEAGEIRGVSIRTGTSFYLYPLNVLRAKSEEGSLFVLHLALEGKVLYDPSARFADVCKHFLYRNSYGQEIREASAAVWFLLEDPGFLQYYLGRKRLIWGLRTILIARSAEQRKPAFSSSALAKLAANPMLESAIDGRFTVPIQMLYDLSFWVVSNFGDSRADLAWPLARAAQQELLPTFGDVAKTIAHESLLAGEKLLAGQLPRESLYT